MEEIYDSVCNRTGQAMPTQSILYTWNAAGHMSGPTFSDVMQQSPFTVVTMEGKVMPEALAEMMVFQIYNQDDQMRWAVRGQAGGAKATVRGPEQKPYRLVATLGKRVHEVKADLEIKDLVMPAR